jgi:uncharacterized protein (TIGR02246 family)
MSIRLTAVLLSLTIMTAAAKAEPVTAALIQSKENDWAAALRSGDIDKLAAMYEDNAWLVVPGAPPFKGAAAVRAALGVLKNSTARITLTTTEVQPIGQDYAAENGLAETLGPDDKADAVKRANYMVVWHRNAKGEWKILRDIVSPN